MNLRYRAKQQAELERRFLDGDSMAARALIRQAMPQTLQLRADDMNVTATGDTTTVFTGYACITGQAYTLCDYFGSYTETVQPGAFAKTLSENADVILCVNHDWNAIPLARTISGTLKTIEDETGLYCEATLDLTRADVHALCSAIDRGDLIGMSFAFVVVRQDWSPDYMQRSILEIDLDGGDESIVTHPANPATNGTIGLRKAQADAVIRAGIPGLVAARAESERRGGAKISASTQEVLQAVLDLISDADDAVDAAQPLLAELIGIPNPDAEPIEIEADAPPADTEARSAIAGAMSPVLARALALLATEGKRIPTH